MAYTLAMPFDGAWAAPQFSVLHTFHGGDGNKPLAGVLLGSGGVLYGTTEGGGASACGGIGCGTVYQLTPPTEAGGRWTESVLYSFTGGNDGSYPQSDLVLDAVSGALYGTAAASGPHLEGTAFMLTPPAVAGESWPLTLMYGFGATHSDGIQPSVGLLTGPGGTFYGTTPAGGVPVGSGQGGGGTAFQLTPPAVSGQLWTQAVIRLFNSDSSGSGPSPGVLLGGPGGSLLGATLSGGPLGEGLVYELVPPGQSGAHWPETRAHVFVGDGANGTTPNSGLVTNGSGVYYGTTQYGGVLNGAHCNNNCGVVFQLVAPPQGSTIWTYTVIYRFKGGADGQTPIGGLAIGAGGVLYGTTFIGGVTPICPDGCGTVFQLTPPAGDGELWQEKVLHRFNQNDGTGPLGRLTIDANGVLYGTTWEGGSTGYGVVFSLTP